MEPRGTSSENVAAISNGSESLCQHQIVGGVSHPESQRKARAPWGITMSTLIQETRLERGWSQGRLLAEMERLAYSRGLSIMSRSSLRTALSRWENGHIAPTAPYRWLLGQLLGLAEEEVA